MKRSVIRSTICLFVFSVPAALPASAQTDEVQLKWKFREGQQLSAMLEQKIDLQISVNGQTIRTKNNSSSWMRWNVRSVENGKAEVAVTIDRMTLDINTPAAAVLVDTDNKEQTSAAAETMAKGLRPLIGVEMSQTMLSSGLIEDVTIPDEALTALKNVTGLRMGDFVKNLSKNSTLAFPDGPLKIGRSWTRSTVAPSPVGEVSVTHKYTYQGKKKVEGKELHAFDADVKMKFANADGGPNIEIQEQSTAGTLYFDELAGRLNHSEIEQKVKMQISVGAQKIDQTLTQTARFSMTESR